MALAAPLDRVEGGVEGLILEASIGKGASGVGSGNYSVVVPGTSGSGRREGRYDWFLGVAVGVALMCGWL